MSGQLLPLLSMRTMIRVTYPDNYNAMRKGKSKIQKQSSLFLPSPTVRVTLACERPFPCKIERINLYDSIRELVYNEEIFMPTGIRWLFQN